MRNKTYNSSMKHHNWVFFPFIFFLFFCGNFSKYSLCIFCSVLFLLFILFLFMSIYENLLINFHLCESKPELQRSAVTPLSCTYLVSRHTFILLCFIRPPSRISHFWFSESSQKRITIIEPLANFTIVKHKSWCFNCPFFVMIHSWLPPVSWHWYKPGWKKKSRKLVFIFPADKSSLPIKLSTQRTYQQCHPSNGPRYPDSRCLALNYQWFVFQVQLIPDRHFPNTIWMVCIADVRGAQFDRRYFGRVGRNKLKRIESHKVNDE